MFSTYTCISPELVILRYPECLLNDKFYISTASLKILGSAKRFGRSGQRLRGELLVFTRMVKET